MNLEQIINDKIGRKQVIAIVAIVTLSSEPYLVALIAGIAIAAQAILDWKKPRSIENVTK